MSLQLFAQQMDRTIHHYGKVKDWNNPVAIFNYTNTSSKRQIVLPIAYMGDASVHFQKDEILPGETIEVYVKFYTEDFGRFERELKFYVSTQDEPIVLKIDGKITSFHPDAFTYCPPVNGASQERVLGFTHKLEVRDAQTNEILTDYDLDIVSSNYKKKRSIDIKDLRKGVLELEDLQPNLYEIEVHADDYHSAEKIVYINKNTGSTVIFLQPETDKPVLDLEIDIPQDDPVEIEEEVIEPEIELVVDADEEEEKDTVVEVVAEVVAEVDTSVLAEDGTLNDSRYKFNHIVFVIDVSASMRKEEKLPLLKYSMAKLIEVLRAEDKVTIITYSSSVDVLADHVSGDQKEQLLAVILALEAKGSSYGSEALSRAYDIAKDKFIEEGNNEVILASDGLFNSSNFKESKVYRKAWWQHKVNKVRLSTIAFGKSKNALKFMKNAAKSGGGSYLQIPDKKTATDVLVDNIMEHSKK